MGALSKSALPLLRHTPKNGHFGSDDVIRRPYSVAAIKYESPIAIEFIGSKKLTYLTGGVVKDINYYY